TDGKRPDGMSLIPRSRGQLLVWDFTCIDPNAPSKHNVDALALAETRKILKYSSLDPSFLFIPIACSILTIFGSKALSFFKELGTRIREKTDQPKESLFLRQRLATAIIRFNYLSFISSIFLALLFYPLSFPVYFY
ncbi:unnamed protein product, partial [Gordionus sp. m RMFG-2023]